MAVMTVGASSSAGLTPRSVDEAAAFNDLNQTAAYAKADVLLLRRAGMLSGDAAGMFLPKPNSSRAEAAKLAYGLLQAN